MAKQTCLFFGVVSMLIVLACKQQETVIPLTDAQLFGASVDTSQFQWYQNDATVKASAAASAHTAYFRVRFNQRAQTVLGIDGKLPRGAVFPEGSVIVKELFRSADGQQVLVAVMIKRPADENAADGWLWGEYHADGRNYVPVVSGATVCAPCHRTHARDGVRVFDAFP